MATSNPSFTSRRLSFARETMQNHLADAAAAEAKGKLWTAKFNRQDAEKARKACAALAAQLINTSLIVIVD